MGKPHAQHEADVSHPSQLVEKLIGESAEQHTRDTPDLYSDQQPAWPLSQRMLNVEKAIVKYTEKIAQLDRTHAEQAKLQKEHEARCAQHVTLQGQVDCLGGL